MGSLDNRMKNKIDNNRRVVVTGLGVVSSLGIGWEEFWKNLIDGKSGISKIESFDTSGYDRHYGGEVKNFKPEDFISKSKIKYLGRASQMAIAASKLAIKDAKIKLTNDVRKRTAVCVGTTTGEIPLLEKFSDTKVKSKENFNIQSVAVYPSSSLSTNIALELKLRNFVGVFATACASGNYSVGHSYDLIHRGKSDFALAGGADAFSRIVFTGFGRLFAIAPEKCQPFDKNRQGMIPGEGAGMIFMETLESALERKANIYAEVLGYGLSCDASHMTEPNVNGICKALQKSMKFSKVTSDQIDYISAHGTGTKENDEAESKAVNRVFGKRGPKIPMSSIKSMLGHTMGAASAFETVVCCLSVARGRAPSTINYFTPDPKCDVNCVFPQINNSQIKFSVNNSQAFGGNNSTVIFKSLILL
jgi:3-oxoacyl-[acyl-carrier-protein] synthase II